MRSCIVHDAMKVADAGMRIVVALHGQLDQRTEQVIKHDFTVTLRDSDIDDIGVTQVPEQHVDDQHCRIRLILDEIVDAAEAHLHIPMVQHAEHHQIRQIARVDSLAGSRGRQGRYVHLAAGQDGHHLAIRPAIRQRSVTRAYNKR